MKSYLYIIVSGLMLSICMGGCKSARQIDSVYANHSFETKCLSCNGWQQTVRAWGKGKNKNDALLNCRRKALEDVLFNGITLGSKECLRKPLIAEANALKKHKEFFNEFFSDKGEWRRFATEIQSGRSRVVSKDKNVENWETSVSIDLRALSDYLRQNGLTVTDY